MPSEAEQKDIDKMNADCQQQQRLFFIQALAIDRANQATMEIMGRGKQTKDQAIADIYRYYRKEIEKIHADFLKRWPD